MSNIRAGITSLKDPDDDYAFQMLKGDVERLRLLLDNLGFLNNVRSISVTVCVDGVEKTMTVLGSDPV